MESFYDERKFEVNHDLKGNNYVLNSNANNMTRSTVLYHPTILSEKRAVIEKANNLINKGQNQKLSNAACLLEVNN